MEEEDSKQDSCPGWDLLNPGSIGPRIYGTEIFRDDPIFSMKLWQILSNYMYYKKEFFKNLNLLLRYHKISKS